MSRAVLPLAALALCLSLTACASGNHSVMIFADPSKYEFYNCQQLASARVAAVAREAELKGLIARAEQGAGGVFVGTIAYRPEYASAGENIRAIDLVARNKNCPPPVPLPRATDSAAVH
jgi:hypothetical protein